jgi:uncharacterized repeat protein (TIGR01451 family)
MSKMLFKMGLGLLVAAGLTWTAAAAVPVNKTLHGHVPSAVSHLTPLRQMADTNVLHLAIGLPLRNQAVLEALKQQIYDPSSPNYHHFLTPAQFTAMFGPSEQDYQAVINFAQTNGLTVSAKYPNRVVLDVTGSAAKIENAFQVKLKIYRHPKENRDFYAPDSNPVVNSVLPILHVSGLDNYSLPHPRSVIRPAGLTANATSKAGSGPGGTYFGTDFRKAYVPGTTLTGAGQNIGLLQFDGYYSSDPAAYAQKLGLVNPPNLVNVPVDGGVSAPGSGNGEVCLDIEMVMAMAPGVSNIYVYEAPNPSPWVDLLSKMANDNLARQLSCSWGGGPPDPTSEQIFQQMALQGQSFFNAVGDSDAFIDPYNPVAFPSDSPHITQVGGTTLATAPDGSFVSETVWNWGGGIGTCGGISPNYSIPVWQQGINMTTNHGSTTMRNMPDVALTADNIFVIADNGQSENVGGTSAATPLWAAFTALVNQQGAANGQLPVGFLNPTLYALSKTANYANLFRDVTTGNNYSPYSPTNFPATPGYDLCTGLGSPNGTNLINALTGGSVVSGPVISAPKGPASGGSWGNTLGVMNGENPNGPWFLFMQDDKPNDIGLINNGWSVALTTANPVGYAADNQLYLASNITNASPGAPWTVSLAVTNYGPSISTNVIVTDTLPTPDTGVTLTNLLGSGAVVYGNTLTWTVGNLAVNAGTSLVLNFYADPTAMGAYTNSAHVSADTTDPNPDDDDGVVTLNISAATASPQLTPLFTTGAGGGFRLSVTADSNVPTIIQASTNLVNWANVFTNTGVFTFTNFDSTNYPMRFYRAVTGH